MEQNSELNVTGPYSDVIMDHYRNPRNREHILDYDIEINDSNPFCGDEVHLKIKLDGLSQISAIGAGSKGCSIIQASTSIMAEEIVGKTYKQIMALYEVFNGVINGKCDPPDLSYPENLLALNVVRDYPVRIKCVLLPWVALLEVLRKI